MKWECCSENVSNSQNSHSNIHKRDRISFISDIFLNFEAESVSDNNEEENSEYLWYDMNCHQKASFSFSAPHQAVTVSTLLLLQASILTEYSGSSSTPWSKEIKTWFHNQINTVWCGARKQYVRTFDISDDTVCTHSMKYEAWEVFSLCGIDWPRDRDGISHPMKVSPIPHPGPVP